MSLALGLWLCVVPIVVYLVALFFDAGIALLAAIVLFLIMLLICNIVCRLAEQMTSRATIWNEAPGWRRFNSSRLLSNSMRVGASLSADIDSKTDAVMWNSRNDN